MDLGRLFALSYCFKIQVFSYFQFAQVILFNCYFEEAFQKYCSRISQILYALHLQFPPQQCYSQHNYYHEIQLHFLFEYSTHYLVFPKQVKPVYDHHNTINNTKNVIKQLLLSVIIQIFIIFYHILFL